MRIVKVIRAERFRRRMSWCEGRTVLARRAPKHGRVSVQGRKKLNGRYPGVEGNCRFDVQEELLQDMGSTPTLFEKHPSVANLLNMHATAATASAHEERRTRRRHVSGLDELLHVAR